MDFESLTPEQRVNRFELLESFIEYGVTEHGAFNAVGYDESIPGLDEELSDMVEAFQQARKNLYARLEEYAKAADNPAYANEVELAGLNSGNVEEQLSLSS